MQSTKYPNKPHHLQNSSLTTTILILLYLTTTPTSSYKSSDFRPSILKPSPPSGYHNIDTGPQTQGQILCIGDINGDQYNDSQTRAGIGYIFLELGYRYGYFIYSFCIAVFQVDQLSLISYRGVLKQIQEVILVDYNGDGVLEILITYVPVNNPITYSTIAYKVIGCHYYKCNYIEQKFNNDTILTNMTSVPAILDLGSSVIGFLTFQGTQRYIIDNRDNNLKKVENYKKITKHYTSVVDFDGDCHADLVLLSVNGANKSVLQFYQKQSNSKYQFYSQLIFDLPVRFYTFIDFDGSGTSDIALIMGIDGEESVYVLPNKYSGLTQICKVFDSFPYEKQNLRKIQLAYQIASGSLLYFGDVNSDSYPDMLTIVTVNDFRKAMLFKNILLQNGDRYLLPAQETNANLISQVKNPKQVAFFDFGEDGKIDIFVMVQQETDSDRTTVITRTCFINNVKDDTLFIKILPLSQKAIYSPTSSQIANTFGVTMQWRITKLDGYKKISLLNQKSQSNYRTLQLPFVCGGLGRTNNYVQDLTIGYSTVGSKMNWSPIIPDSKLLVYQKDGEWKLQTLLANNERVNQVVYVSVCILILLGVIVFFLNYRENLEDKKDQYNFIQLIR